jgi:hypothetical protein
VLFNPTKSTLKTIQEADKARKLDKVAKPVSEYFNQGGRQPAMALRAVSLATKSPRTNRPTAFSCTRSPDASEHFWGGCAEDGGRNAGQEFRSRGADRWPGSRWWGHPERAAQESALKHNSLGGRSGKTLSTCFHKVHEMSAVQAQRASRSYTGKPQHTQ